MTINLEIIAGRNIWAAEPPSLKNPSLPQPQDALVFLHALTMTNLTMFNCVNAKNVANSNMIGLSPDSMKLTEWDYNANSSDVIWLDTAFPAAILQKYPSVTRIHLIGFSNGGETANAVAAFGNNHYYSYTQVCATRRKDQTGSKNQLPPGTPVQIYLGADDPLVPVSGNSNCLSLSDIAQFFQSIGSIASTSVIPNCGHAWPGGVAPPPMVTSILGGWPNTPDMTSMLVNLIQSWRTS